MISHSELGQDVRLNKEMFHDRRGLTFVDVGAFDGVEFSNTLHYERNFGWTGLCIEPHPRHFDALKANRPNSICVNAAAGSAVGTKQFLCCWSDKFRQFDMLSCLVDAASPRRRLAHSNWRTEYDGHVDEIAVNVTTLGHLLAKHRLLAVDYLTIDAEGSEFEVLKGIDFRVQINVIELEVAYRDTGDDLRETAEMYDFLESHNFRHGFDLAEGRDRVFINNQLKWSC